MSALFRQLIGKFFIRNSQILSSAKLAALMLGLILMAQGAKAGASPVVAVEGELAGSGVVVIYNGAPAVLTVSHLLEGRERAKVFLPQAVPATVIFDSPGFDIAVLSLPRSLNEDLRARAIIELCPSSSIGPCSPNLFSLRPAHSASSDIHRVEFIDQHRLSSTPLLDPKMTRLMYDSYVTGAYDHVVLVPAYLRPGASGGALFINGQFFGLIDKVSASGEPIAFAIPLTDIARVLVSEREGFWTKTANGFRLTVHVLGQTVSSIPSGGRYINGGGELTNGGGELTNGGGELTNGGGELTNGGGELTNGGGELTNGGGGNRRGRETKYWTLQFSDRSRSSTTRSVQTMNPFIELNQDLEVNGKKVAFVRMTTHDGTNESFYLGPNSSNFVFYTRAQASVKIFAPSSESAEKLKRIRAMTEQKVRSIRLYEAKAGGVFEERNQTCELVSTDALVNANCPGSSGSTNLEISRDFSSVRLKSAKGTIDLKMASAKDNYTSILFKDSSDRSGARAVIIFDNDDLSRIDRIFVQTEGQLAELLTCTPGQNCVR